jgi:hypothetical protein
MKKLFLLLALCAFITPVYGQIAVNLSIKRRIHVLNEPVLATVAVTNNSGRELMLADSDLGQWFSFTIVNAEGRAIPPRDPDYSLAPLSLQPGETMKRTVNLNELYSISDYGLHKIRANIFHAGLNKYFSSNPDHLDLTEGRRIWKQTVGVPDGGDSDTRIFTLMTLDHDDGKQLYVRITGDDDVVYGCYALGKLLDGSRPETQFDLGNNLWVLQLVGQRTYFLTRIGVNGDFQAQSTYVTPKSKPYLRKLADGTLQLVGAVRQERVAAQNAAPVPKLSDRPAGLPR